MTLFEGLTFEGCGSPKERINFSGGMNEAQNPRFSRI